MSFAGSVLNMITTLKNNSMMKDRVSSRFEQNKKSQRYKKHIQLKYKELPKKELELLKTQIRERARKDKIRNWIVSIVLILLLFVLGGKYLYRIGLRFKNSEKARIEQAELERIRKQQAINEKYYYYLNEGYKWLNKGHYKNAKTQIYNALDVKPNDYKANLAYATAFIYDCIQNNSYCQTSEELLKNIDKKFPNRKEIQELKDIYSKKILY